MASAEQILERIRAIHVPNVDLQLTQSSPTQPRRLRIFQEIVSNMAKKTSHHMIKYYNHRSRHGPKSLYTLCWLQLSTDDMAFAREYVIAETKRKESKIKGLYDK